MPAKLLHGELLPVHTMLVHCNTACSCFWQDGSSRWWINLIYSKQHWTLNTTTWTESLDWGKEPFTLMERISLNPFRLWIIMFSALENTYKHAYSLKIPMHCLPSQPCVMAFHHQDQSFERAPNLLSSRVQSLWCKSSFIRPNDFQDEVGRKTEKRRREAACR